MYPSWFEVDEIRVADITAKINKVVIECKDFHNNQTPIELCCEIVDKLHQQSAFSSDSKVLVVANIEFVFVMLAYYKHYSYNKSNIYFVTPDQEKADWVKLQGINVGIYDYKDLNLGVFNMKFDVVVGNPPYQDGGRDDASHKLWPQFIMRSIDILHNNGFLSMITPSSWGSPGVDIQGKNSVSILRDVFAKKQLVIANIDSNSIKTTYFPTVGSTFSWWIVKNTKYDNQSVFNTTIGEVSIDIRGLHALPVITTEVSISILNKFNTNETVPFVFDHIIPSDKKHLGTHFLNEQTDDFNYINYHTPARGGTYKFSKICHPNTSLSKVLISKSGNYLAVSDHGNIGYTGMCIVFLTNYPDNMATVFNSKLYRFVIHNNKYNGFVPITVITKLHTVDFSRSWTDQELYQHFNLTLDEIKLIEATIK